jgi:hypothetical protein
VDAVEVVHEVRLALGVRVVLDDGFVDFDPTLLGVVLRLLHDEVWDVLPLHARTRQLGDAADDLRAVQEVTLERLVCEARLLVAPVQELAGESRVGDALLDGVSERQEMDQLGRGDEHVLALPPEGVADAARLDALRLTH